MNSKFRIAGHLVLVLTCLLLLVAVACSNPAPSATPTPSAKPAPASSPSPTATATAKPTTTTPAPVSPTPKEMALSFGSTSSTSGAYVWAVAVGRVITKYAPGLTTTIVESNGGYDNINKIRQGVFIGSLADGWQASYEMIRGLETYKGNAWDGIRWFFMRDLSPTRMYVRADSPYKFVEDLKGKKIYAGQPGTAAADRTVVMSQVLGLGNELIPGSLQDGISMLQTGRLDSVAKGGPIKNFDAALTQAHMKTPLRAISFTEAGAAKLSKAYPQFLVTKTPANVIKELPGHDALWEIYSITGGHASNKMSQDVGYRVAKAVYEHWQEIVAAYPSSGEIDPIIDYIKTVPPGAEVPLHAGTVQLAKEKGINIPAAFIPPEYKP